ncbi:tetratricopeptide repeat protein [Gimesia sp.]|uniref:tetratricopeptide repeat protein n=1 Tax=Gimesia sp. TaxID=2024833 RepID=UPI003A93A805
MKWNLSACCLNYLLALLVVPFLSVEVCLAQDALPGVKSEASSAELQEKQKEALAHAQQGQALLNQKDWKGAIAEFEQSVELQPENSMLHYLLGIAYLENSQASKSWVEIRKAVLLDTGNKRAVQDYLKFWSFFDRKGILNVGTPEVEVLKLLGKPDSQRENKGETRLIYGFMWLNFRNASLYAVIDTRGLSAKYMAAVKSMKFHLGDPWREGYRMMNSTNALTEYIIPPETVQDYQQLFSTQRLFKLGEQTSAREMMNRMKSLVEKSYQLEEWNVIEDGEDDILYEWRVAKSDNTPAQHEINRMVRGGRDMHRLGYVSRKLPLKAADREEWIKRLKSADLIVAHPETANLTAAQKQELADQLKSKSREIIKKQLQYIRKGDVASMQPYFTERVRKFITKESLNQAKAQAESANPEELVHDIEIQEVDGTLQAKIKMKNGRTLTTLVPVNGKWEADTIWFE